MARGCAARSLTAASGQRDSGARFNRSRLIVRNQCGGMTRCVPRTVLASPLCITGRCGSGAAPRSEDLSHPRGRVERTELLFTTWKEALRPADLHSQPNTLSGTSPDIQILRATHAHAAHRPTNSALRWLLRGSARAGPGGRTVITAAHTPAHRILATWLPGEAG